MMNIRIFAAIDIGSNAIRLLINNIYQSEEKIVYNKSSLVRVPVRLGYDAFVEENISEENQKRLLEAMQAYKLLMNVHKVEKYQAFATSAMRESKNKEEVIQKIQETTGIEIEIISGKKEAEVVFNTQLYDQVHPHKKYLYVDVGGGSTEITLFSNRKIISSRSFKIGTVRLLHKKVKKSYLKKEVKPWVEKQLKGSHHIELIGSGGNINYIFKLEGNKIGKPLKYKQLRNRYKELKDLTYEQRLEDYNMKPDRADVIIPALKIYTSIMKYSNAKFIHVPKMGVSDGMIQYMFMKQLDEQKQST